MSCHAAQRHVLVPRRLGFIDPLAPLQKVLLPLVKVTSVTYGELVELTYIPLKIDGWKMKFPFSYGPFSEDLCQFFRGEYLGLRPRWLGIEH